MDQLDIVREWAFTEQQKECFILYEDHVFEYGRHPSKRDFVEFYKMWLYNQKKVNDLSKMQIEAL